MKYAKYILGTDNGLVGEVLDSAHDMITVYFPRIGETVTLDEDFFREASKAEMDEELAEIAALKAEDAQREAEYQALKDMGLF